MFKELTKCEEEIFNKLEFNSIRKDSFYKVGDFLINQGRIYVILEVFENFICVSNIFTERVYLYMNDKVKEFETISFISISDKKKYLNRINYNNKELYQKILTL
ncbi:hypothetical protein [uncultured Tissierella sp.]|uniref:hypothetical protein n=1 Tax=uncultured Tissierella sp. TaxID=448160 RepID=UPI002804B107|nr:hypothetical protein [uncultured Tissierella sp.]MDU5080529.1 hypothetical protein [Bacillota bacterium]